MLEDLRMRIMRINRITDNWDERIADAGNHGKAGAAGKLLDACQRDYVRWDVWQDPKTNKNAVFNHPEDAVEFISDRLQEIANDITEEWRGCSYRPSGSFTRSDDTKWKLREISDGLKDLINGVAQE